MIESLEFSQDLHFKIPYLDEYLSNIKMHNKFLVTQIRKVKQKAKDLQNQIKLKNDQILILKQQNSIFQQRYFDIKQILQEKLTIISQKFISLVSEEKNNQRIQKQSFQQGQTMSQSSKNLLNNQHPLQLSDLHNQFNALMYEYKADSNIQSRKKCIEVMKKMLQKKQQLQLSSRITERNGKEINYCSKYFHRENIINEISLNNLDKVPQKPQNYKSHRYTDSQNILRMK